MWYFYLLDYQMELFQLTAVLLSGGHDIDSGKEFAKIIGKHFSSVHIGSRAKTFHLCPIVLNIVKPSFQSDLILPQFLSLIKSVPIPTKKTRRRKVCGVLSIKTKRDV